MTKIRFAGFADEAVVEIAVTKDNVTKGPLSVSAWKQTGAVGDGPVGNLQITMFREPSISAPEHVRFTADVLSATGLRTLTNDDVGTATYDTYDQQLHELEFVWTFNTATDPQPDSLTFSGSSRLPAAWKTKSKATGKHAAHIFEKEGDYTYMCEAYRVDYNSGAGTQSFVLVARKSGTITVVPADAFYAGAQTVCIDPDGNTDEIPTGAVVFTTFQAFRDGWGDAGGDGNLQNRILFRRGKTHTGWVENSYSTGRRDMTFGAYGTGARPILDISGAGGNVFQSQGSVAADPRGYWRFIGLDVRGSWDSANETGTRDTFVALKSPCNLVVFDCVIDGVEKVVSGDMAPAGTPADSSIWFYDSQLLSFRDYGIQAAKTDLQWIIIRGSRMTRALDAAGYANGGKDGANDPRNWHGPLRISQLAICLIQASDFYNRSSWGNGAAPQPNWRIGSDGVGNDWSLIAVNNVVEGGSVGVSTSTANSGIDINPANCLIKHNVFIADYQTSGGVVVARGATTVQENMFIFPDITRTQWDSDNAQLTTQIGKRQRSGAISQSVTDNDVGTNRQEPVRIIGNLTIDLKTPNGVDDEIDGLNQFTFMLGLVELRDNLTYAPRYPTPILDHGPMQAVLSIASYNTYGARWENKATGVYQEYTQDQDGKTLLTPGGAVDVLQPQSGAGLAATGPQCMFDVLGFERNATTVGGAIEAAD